MRILTRALAVLLAAGLPMANPTWSLATNPPVRCSNPGHDGQCVVHVRAPGQGGGKTPGVGGSGGFSTCTDKAGSRIPCTASGGSWDSSLQCYLSLEQPQPPKSDPVWQGHRTGAIYVCLAYPVCQNCTQSGLVWLPAPPAGIADPRVLAQQALKTLNLPLPSGHRSPGETHRYRGYPFTYVNFWTWFWTDRGTWRPLSATARAGGVWATVTVRPTELLFSPGDGSAPVACPGPGRPWRSADGNAAPSSGGCGYRYLAATDLPITSQQTVRWSVSWRASDGSSGTLPDVTTARSGSLRVLQIQAVVTR